MTDVKKEITKEEYEKAMESEDGAYCLISDSVKMGYGAYSARVFEKDGKYYLSFRMGSSCD
jgi:hypothetical protein